MSRINNYFLMREEKALEHMREVQQAMYESQDNYQDDNARWWVDEDSSPEYIKHCESLLNQQPF